MAMKKLLFIVFAFFTMTAFAQSTVKITPKSCISKKGYHLRLKSIVSDSRCPEGVTCIWAGEVSAIVEVYKDREFVMENVITFNAKNREENMAWFSKYYPEKITNIEVGPYPKEGVVIKPKSATLKSLFNDSHN